MVAEALLDEDQTETLDALCASVDLFDNRWSTILRERAAESPQALSLALSNLRDFIVNRRATRLSGAMRGFGYQGYPAWMEAEHCAEELSRRVFPPRYVKITDLTLAELYANGMPTNRRRRGKRSNRRAL